MEIEDWFDMSSPYDGQSVMHYSATSFLTSQASSAGLYAITDINTGLGVQWPRVDRMSSEDCYQLQKMYDNFCAPLPSRSCDSGDQYLKNRACDGVSDCADGSDETLTICNEVCNSANIWVSADNCLDSTPAMPYLGKYNQMTETLVNGFPRTIKVAIPDALGSSWLSGTYYQIEGCEGFTEPSYQKPGESHFIWRQGSLWYFGTNKCDNVLSMYYQDDNNANNANFWAESGATYNYFDGSGWVPTNSVVTTVMSIGYDHQDADLFIFRQLDGNWVGASTIDGTPIVTFGSGNCPQGTYDTAKIDYEVGDAVICSSDEVCNSASIWVSADNCLDSNPAMPYLGKYDQMTETLVNGFPRTIKVDIPDALGSSWLSGTYYQIEGCEGFTEPSYQKQGEDHFIWRAEKTVWRESTMWHFGTTNCDDFVSMFYRDRNHANNTNFWEESEATYIYRDDGGWDVTNSVVTTAMSIGYGHQDADLFIFRQLDGNWVGASTIDGTPLVTFGSGNCPQGTYNTVKIDYEVGDAVICSSGTTTVGLIY